MERDAAWGVEYLMKPCTETTIRTITGNKPTITCPFAMHLLGSREVGKGPFLHNTLEVNVTDGKIIWVDRKIPFETNGIQQHVESVFDWIVENHPRDEPFLDQDEQDVGPAEWPRWTRLWKQYTQEYVAAKN